MLFLSTHFLDICNDNIVSLCGHISMTIKSRRYCMNFAEFDILLKKAGHFNITIYYPYSTIKLVQI